MRSKEIFAKNKLCMNPAMNATKSKGRVFEQSLGKYFELTESDELAQLVASIRKAEDSDERRALKANLPFRCPHYFRFKDDRRSQATIIPEAFTWQTCVDIDDASQVEGAITRAYLLNTEEGMWKDQLLYMDYSTSWVVFPSMARAMPSSTRWPAICATSVTTIHAGFSACCLTTVKTSSE